MSDVRELDEIGEPSAQKLEETGLNEIDALAVVSPGELMGVLDIGETTAADIIDQARDRLMGSLAFESATDIEPSADFTEVDVPESVSGWELYIRNQSHIGWRSPSSYRIVIKGHQRRIWGHLPQEDPDTPETITTEQILQSQMESPEQAVEWVKRWMSKRAIDPDSDLTDYTGIGDRVAEHLQIVYGIYYGQELYRFLVADKRQVQDVIGAQYIDQLTVELESEFD